MTISGKFFASRFPPHDCRSRGDCGEKVFKASSPFAKLRLTIAAVAATAAAARIRAGGNFFQFLRLTIAAVAATAAYLMGEKFPKISAFTIAAVAATAAMGRLMQFRQEEPRLTIASVAATAAILRYMRLIPFAASRLPQSRRLRQICRGEKSAEKPSSTASRLPQSRRLRLRRKNQRGDGQQAASRFLQSRRLRPSRC